MAKVKDITMEKEKTKVIWIVEYEGEVVTTCGISLYECEAKDRIDMFLDDAKAGRLGDAVKPIRFYKCRFKVVPYFPSSFVQ